MKRIYFSLLCLGLSFNTFAADSASAPDALAKSGVTISAASCETDSPCRAVADTSTKVLDAVNKGFPQSQTMPLIQTIVVPSFDFTLMTKYAMGNNWKLATPDQQAQLVDLFKQLLIYTYSTALSKFKGAQINIISSNIINDKKAEVIGHVTMASANGNSQPVKVEYDLAKTTPENPWKAYDIKIENASLVTTYRNQFNEVVQSSKIDGLIKQLQTKVNSIKGKSA